MYGFVPFCYVSLCLSRYRHCYHCPCLLKLSPSHPPANFATLLSLIPADRLVAIPPLLLSLLVVAILHPSPPTFATPLSLTPANLSLFFIILCSVCDRRSLAYLVVLLTSMLSMYIHVSLATSPLLRTNSVVILHTGGAHTQEHDFSFDWAREHGPAAMTVPRPSVPLRLTAQSSCPSTQLDQRLERMSASSRQRE